jgi:hypothetical protein
MYPMFLIYLIGVLGCTLYYMGQLADISHSRKLYRQYFSERHESYVKRSLESRYLKAQNNILIVPLAWPLFFAAGVIRTVIILFRDLKRLRAFKNEDSN